MYKIYQVIVTFIIFFDYSICSGAHNFDEIVRKYFERSDKIEEKSLKNAPEDFLSHFHYSQNQLKSAKYNVVHFPQLHYIEDLKNILTKLDKMYKEEYVDSIDFSGFFIKMTMEEFEEPIHRRNVLAILGDIFASQYMIYNEISETIKKLQHGEKVTIFYEGLPYLGWAFNKIDPCFSAELDFKYEFDSFYSLIVNGAGFVLKYQYPDKVALVGTELPLIPIKNKKVFNKKEPINEDFEYFSSLKELESDYNRCIDLTYDKRSKDFKCNRLLSYRQRETNAVVSINHYLNKYKTKNHLFLIYGANHVFSTYNDSNISFRYSNFDYGSEFFNKARSKINQKNFLRSYNDMINKDFNLMYPFLLENSNLALKENINLVPIYDFAHPDCFKFHRNLFLGSTFASLFAFGFLYFNSFFIY